MVIITQYSTAIILCIITMICWGSWANMQKATKQSWGFQLFYWDYSIGVLLLSVIFAFTLGSHGDIGRSFLTDLHQASKHNIMLALLSGVVFNLANILLVTAIDLAGMAVAFPLAIGLALVIGTLSNYFVAPSGNPLLIVLGLILIVIAIVLDALAYGAIERKSGHKKKGFIISILCGVLMGFFYPILADAMSVAANPTPLMLTPYTAAVLFAVGLVLSNLIFNSYMMARPLSGKPVTYKQYFTSGNLRTHVIGILGGMIWCVGLSFDLIASGPAGFAISFSLGQGATMIAAFWGVFIWKEFKNASTQTKNILFWMFICYIVGLACIAASHSY
jgi:glucose uptake protein